MQKQKSITDNLLRRLVIESSKSTPSKTTDKKMAKSPPDQDFHLRAQSWGFGRQNIDKLWNRFAGDFKRNRETMDRGVASGTNLTIWAGPCHNL